MEYSDRLRNSLIDKLLLINNAEFLSALDKLIDSARIGKGTLKLTEEQKVML
jgi:hypothetical protein